MCGSCARRWSNTGAVLDAQGKGRVFSVSWGGHLTLHGITLRNGYTNYGGCGWVVSHGTLVADGVSMTNCGTNEEGGALYADFNSVLNLTNSVFDGCWVHSKNSDEELSTLSPHSSDRVMGGAIAVSGSRVNLVNVSFLNSSVFTQTFHDAFGGAVAVMFGGYLQMQNVTFSDAQVVAGRLAFGGCLGVEGGTVVGFGMTFNGCRALFVEAIPQPRPNASTIAEAAGGAIATLGGRTRLYHVHISNAFAMGNASHDAGTRNAQRGAAVIQAQSESFQASFVTISQVCGESERSLPLLKLFFSRQRGPSPILNLRALTLNVVGCDVILEQGSRLADCTFPGSCGPLARCTMLVTHNETRLSTPLCSCPPNNKALPFVPYAASEDARSDETAAYEPTGCVRVDWDSPAEDMQLNPNWWRLSNDTTDIRQCLAFWQPGQPTPCSGGRNSTSYCKTGLDGPRCSVCLDEGVHFDEDAAACVECPTIRALVLFLSIMVSAILLAVICVFVRRRDRVRIFGGRCAVAQQAVRAAVSFFSVEKLKIFFGHFQERVEGGGRPAGAPALLLTLTLTP